MYPDHICVRPGISYHLLANSQQADGLRAIPQLRRLFKTQLLSGLFHLPVPAPSPPQRTCRPANGSRVPFERGTLPPSSPPGTSRVTVANVVIEAGPFFPNVS